MDYLVMHVPGDSIAFPVNPEVEMVLTYVPEAEYMSWELAVFTASCRDVESARQFEWSVMDD